MESQNSFSEQSISKDHPWDFELMLPLMAQGRSHVETYVVPESFKPLQLVNMSLATTAFQGRPSDIIPKPFVGGVL